MLNVENERLQSIFPKEDIHQQSNILYEQKSINLAKFA